MWKFRVLGRVFWLRQIVKYLFGLMFYEGRVTKILFGPLRGVRWVCSRAHQFWMPLGLYENETAEWLVNTIQEGDIFLDIGANAGYFSLIGSKYVGERGKVVHS